MTQPPDTGMPRKGLLDRIAAAGDRLPDPTFIFLGCIAVIIAVSVIGAAAGWSAIAPATGNSITVESLLSEKNAARFFVDMPDTLTAFPPLGLVLVVMLGAAVAERSGLFSALMGAAVRGVPKSALTPLIFIIGLFSHHAADAAYVVLIPLSALVYAEAGRHPLAGVAIAYAGISGAFAGNVIPGQFDILMLGITEAAARLVDPNYVMNPLGNWWFTLAIGVLFTPIAWFVTDRVVEPRLGVWRGGGPVTPSPGADFGDLTPAQRRGLVRAGLAAAVIVALFAALTLWPGYTPLFDEAARGPQRMTPFYTALVAGFMLLFFVCGWAYGSAAGTVKAHRDTVAMMNDGLRDIAPYVVLVFFAAHFVAMFSWSNLGPVTAVHGAQVLRELGLPNPAVLSSLLLMTSGLDLVIGSASAKWSAMAPVVVPMLMLVDISPEMTTAAFRMGDSIFNIVTPLASNFPLALIMCQRWKPEFGVGSMISLMLPYSLSFMAGGIFLLLVWSGFELPVGPGAPASYSERLVLSAPAPGP
ncbi:MAG: AbgT family transporter [Rhodospirillaceae bacterium]|nr:AbgT family transporter [Rhodospirillaceae bacterium]